MRINTLRLRHLRSATHKYRQGAKDLFDRSEVYTIAEAKWKVDAHQGRPRLTVEWTNPRGWRDSATYIAFRPYSYNGFEDALALEKYIKEQYDRFARALLMEDVYYIRKYLTQTKDTTNDRSHQ